MRTLGMVVLLLALGLLPIGNAGAAPPLRPLGPPTVVAVMSDGQRLIAYQHREDSREWTVIDTKTDRRWQIARPEGCGGVRLASAPRGIGERGLLLSCAPGDALLDLRTGRLQALPENATFYDVGRHWASGDGASCRGRPCRTFVNLDTGERRKRRYEAAPIDLDAADFRPLKICRPFDAGDIKPPGGPGAYDPPFLLGYEDNRLALRRCGRTRTTRLSSRRDRQPSDDLTTYRASLVDGVAAWTTATHLRAYDARERRRFAWRLPGARGNGAEVLQTRWRVLAAVVKDVHTDVIETPGTYRLSWARTPR